MSILDDSIKVSEVDVRKILENKKKFYIRPDVNQDVFIRENRGYAVWFSATCGYSAVEDISMPVEKDHYDRKLEMLYDMISEFPGVVECSPIWIVSRFVVDGEPAGGTEVCFGIDADVRSIYGALRLVYSLCSLLWSKETYNQVPICVMCDYDASKSFSRTYVNHDFFKSFYDVYYDRNSKSLKNMFGPWKIFAAKLWGRPFYELESWGVHRLIKKCSDWYERTYIDKKFKNALHFSTDFISAVKEVNSQVKGIERYRGSL